MEFDYGFIMVCVDGYNYLPFSFEKDLELQAEIHEKSLAFWENILLST